MDDGTKAVLGQFFTGFRFWYVYPPYIDGNRY